MELRKDYILNRYVIVSTGRGKRPFEFKQEKVKETVKKCSFCPGNESLTTPETGRLEKRGKWKIRWFPNKFPAVIQEGDSNLKTTNNFFTSASAYGKHEIIVETPNHKKQLCDLTKEEIKAILEVYAKRIEELSKLAGIKYVCVFKNHGKEAGTSIVHAHSQVIAYNKTPELIKEEVKATKRFDHCPYCRILLTESKSARRCFENNSFVAFTPYASRFHFEIWIFPKKHIRNITEMDSSKLTDLAKILKLIIKKLKKLNASYNMQLHYAPAGKDLHFHIEICPRLATWGGFECLTNDTINSLPPEDAAKFYRGKK